MDVEAWGKGWWMVVGVGQVMVSSHIKAKGGGRWWRAGVIIVVLSHIETEVGISNNEINQKKKKHTLGLNDASDASFMPWMWWIIVGVGPCGVVTHQN